MNADITPMNADEFMDGSAVIDGAQALESATTFDPDLGVSAFIGVISAFIGVPKTLASVSP